jgi:hypothetical protein
VIEFNRLNREGALTPSPYDGNSCSFWITLLFRLLDDGQTPNPAILTDFEGHHTTFSIIILLILSRVQIFSLVASLKYFQSMKSTVFLDVMWYSLAECYQRNILQKPVIFIFSVEE